MDPLRDMNSRQRIVLVFTGVAILVMILFPPYQQEFGNGASMNLGYSFLFAPPNLPGFSGYGSVNVNLLLVEILGAVIAGGLIWFGVGHTTES